MATYSVFYVNNKGYQYSNVVSWSHYDDPLEVTLGRAAGNSRVWGDASQAVQQQVIDQIIQTADSDGLTVRDTAYLLAMARVESGFNPDAAAGTTSASGLGQFVDATGQAYGLDDSNRFDLTANVDALIAAYLDAKALADSRGLPEEYIYKFHHDGPTNDYGGLQLALSKIMPLVNLYERALLGGGAPSGGGNSSGGGSGGGSVGGVGPGDVLGLVPGAANGAMDRVKNLVELAKSVFLSPFVLDLSGDGLQTVNLSNGAHFDHEADGHAEKTAWISPEDGFLAWDRNGDGRINSGAELFGDQTVLADGSKGDGFAALSELDSNGDWKIDVNDQAWTDLKIWQDEGNDGFSSPDELHRLEDYGIASINVAGEDFQPNSSYFTDAQGVYHGYTTTFTRADGTTSELTDLWFEVDKTYSIATDLIVESTEIRALPNATGYGNMYDLRQAMARDSSGRLKTLVTEFVSQDDSQSRSETLSEILYTWAGSMDLDPTPYVSYSPLNAKAVAVVEQFVGENFGGGPLNGYPGQIDYLWQAYQGLSEFVYAQLMAQSRLKPYFDLVTYATDPASGQLDGALAAVGRQLDQLYAQNPLAGESDFLEFVRSVKGLVAEDTLNLDSLRVSSATSWLLDSYDEQRYIGTDQADVILGTSASEVIRAQGGNDTIIDVGSDNAIWGGDGNDSISVQSYGSNVVDGGSGDDLLRVSRDYPEASQYSVNTFSGGTGNDRTEGAAGADTYLFNRGDGQDVIEDDDFGYGTSQDAITFGAGIAIADLAIARLADDLIISINSTTDKLTIQNWFLGSEYRIENLQFSDGSRLGIDDVHTLMTVGTDGNDVVQSWDPDWSSPLVLTGYAGDDILTGAADNDILDGGAGNDTLAGGLGDDTYVFARGYGQDVIQENDATVGNQDRVSLGANALDVVFASSGTDLVMSLHGGTDSLTVQDFFGDSAHQTEVMQTADSKQLLNTQVDQLIQAMATFSADNGGITWDQALDQRPQDVEAVIAAYWQPAA